jgi:hypothetical protein
LDQPLNQNERRAYSQHYFLNQVVLGIPGFAFTLAFIFFGGELVGVGPARGGRGVTGSGGLLGEASWRLKWANRVIAGLHGVLSTAWAVVALWVLCLETQKNSSVGRNEHEQQEGGGNHSSFLLLPIPYDLPRDRGLDRWWLGGAVEFTLSYSLYDFGYMALFEPDTAFMLHHVSIMTCFAPLFVVPRGFVVALVGIAIAEVANPLLGVWTWSKENLKHNNNSATTTTTTNSETVTETKAQETEKSESPSSSLSSTGKQTSNPLFKPSVSDGTAAVSQPPSLAAPTRAADLDSGSAEPPPPPLHPHPPSGSSSSLPLPSPPPLPSSSTAAAAAAAAAVAAHDHLHYHRATFELLSLPVTAAYFVTRGLLMPLSVVDVGWFLFVQRRGTPAMGWMWVHCCFGLAGSLVWVHMLVTGYLRHRSKKGKQGETPQPKHQKEATKTEKVD